MFICLLVCPITQSLNNEKKKKCHWVLVFIRYLKHNKEKKKKNPRPGFFRKLSETKREQLWLNVIKWYVKDKPWHSIQTFGGRSLQGVEDNLLEEMGDTEAEFSRTKYSHLNKNRWHSKLKDNGLWKTLVLLNEKWIKLLRMRLEI